MYCFAAKEIINVSELNENFSDSMMFLHLLCEDCAQRHEELSLKSYVYNSEGKIERKIRYR